MPQPKLKTDSEFSRLLPPANREEKEQLKAQLIAEGGPRDPICTWGETIVDGHRRYELCRELDLPYRTQELEFSGRPAAKRWLLEHQLARRNLAPHHRAFFLTTLLQLEHSIDKAGGKKRREGAAKAVARKTGVSERTVYRAQEDAETMEAGPESIQEEFPGLPGPEALAEIAQREVPELRQTVQHELSRKVKRQKQRAGAKGLAIRRLGGLKRMVDGLKRDRKIAKAVHHQVIGLLNRVGTMLSGKTEGAAAERGDSSDTM
ncbi:unnamed protein product [marine sediment metagenome]|uniref:ParB/Sulfiredoxin domain-containing protein n=1 Tax=marine sediment metagenome TaxID=412755 RepID=X1FE90_9ZZZZ